MGFGIKTRLKKIPIIWVNQKIKWYKFINQNKKKIFIYTDSRGMDILKKDTKNNPFGFFIGDLIKKYNVDFLICPEKHTTIADFIRTFEKQSKKYDFVIAYIGIVDFSPRHCNIAREVYNLKKENYDKIFTPEQMSAHIYGNMSVEYEGVKTNNMFSLEMAEKNLVPYFQNIPNFIWINCNSFVRGWDGNYFKKRPDNIYLIEEYSKIITSKLKYVVDLLKWNDQEIKQFTCDNIHLTKQGSKYIFKQIEEIIK